MAGTERVGQIFGGDRKQKRDLFPREPVLVGQELLPWGKRLPILVSDERISRSSQETNDNGLHTLVYEDQSLVNALSQRLQACLAGQFTQMGCEVIEWQPAWDTESGHRLGEDEQTFAVFTNTIHIDLLPKGSSRLLSVGNKISQAVYNSLKGMMAKSAPEHVPAVATHGYIKGAEGANPNFTNIFFIRDDKALITELHKKGISGNPVADERFVEFNRLLMLKYGSFRTLIIPYRINEDNIAEADLAILGTLEGGHPGFGFNSDEQLAELARRIKVLASTKPVKTEVSVHPEQSISEEEWEKSKTVRGIQKLGQFLGDKKLLSPPFKIEDYSRSKLFIRVVSRIAGYNRQAEGAFGFWDPKLQKYVVTCTGKLGAVKTDLGLRDMVAVEPNDHGGVNKIRVGEIDPNDPSVEAEEFVIPMTKLAERLRLKVKKTENGYESIAMISKSGFILSETVQQPEALLTDNQGDEDVDYLPPILGIVHIHRGIKEINENEIIRVDTSQFDPVGCGVDAMNEMSQYVMDKSLELAMAFYKRTGRMPKCSVFDVPNHGTNALVFPSVDQETGLIPENFTDIFITAVGKGNLVYKRTVDQR